MARRRAQPPNRLWDRVEAVMKVQMGQADVVSAAQALGLSRMQYYRIEEAMLRAALEAVTPKKRGRKPRISDPKMAALEERLREIEREKELLSLRAKELERVNDEMRRRGIGADGGKNRKRSARKKVSRRLSAADPRGCRPAIKGEDGAGVV